ncbi:hypothetical protein CGCSCA5_v014724 [Colletotrichum siamense]|nr:hypothetical protein CGCSCA5_v014724 [Colletotrichum siamense]KAH0433109.1 hypothetical protein CcaCcLH18_05996 [Colletotrichum camelliae]KAI8166526.1 hypothetical protein K4K50_008466 [Colletotrichum sp. SAR 10_71]KAI8181507.1 hypothetical protein K4K51_001748 [Colletotrichum sp. SAR 10_75]KAI8188647.1 hypothetical protein K4K49_012731 [Colletotrichum sp. SAR 10_70]KAI8211237.1 hypothetical protein K4K52_010915 [Colletotrichum sp. SAR 10_76]KAI8233089.1 hypothetical protein K4K54_010972 [
MMFIHSFIVALAALGASAAPAPQTSGTPDAPAEDRCSGVTCPENSYCKVFDFRLEKPVACQANGTVSEESQACGSVICPVGTTCCNSSCGVCAKPEESCLQWVC